MNIYESAEDYLEQILMLLEQKGHARSIDIAAGLNVSKPSVSVAMKKLRENGYTLQIRLLKMHHLMMEQIRNLTR